MRVCAYVCSIHNSEFITAWSIFIYNDTSGQSSNAGTVIPYSKLTWDIAMWIETTDQLLIDLTPVKDS